VARCASSPAAGSLSSAALAAQFAEQPSRAGKMIVEDAAGDIEQLADERVAQGVADRQSFLLRRDDVLVAKNGQLLRNQRLVECECFLQFLHGPCSPDENLQHANSGGMRQGAKELRFEGLQLIRDDEFRARAIAQLRRCH
jgi:hypothetical protein